MSKITPEIEAYTKLLMQCVSDEDSFDEGLVQYLLNYKKDVIDGNYFIQRYKYGVVKSNLWGYIKSQPYNGSSKIIERWSKILGKDIDEKVIYQYLKFNFHDQNKSERKSEYKPLYFRDNIINNDFLEVSEDFLTLVQSPFHKLDKPLDIAGLTSTEMKLIINDLFNDDNIDRYNRFSQQAHGQELIKRVKNFLIDNYSELEQLCKVDKKTVLRAISMGTHHINNAFQSIVGKEREDFIQKYNLEDKLLTYMRYKDMNKDFFINLLYDYKDKSFWINELNCFNSENNTFSIHKAVHEIFDINGKIDEMYKKKETIRYLDAFKFNLTNLNKDSSQQVMDVLNFFYEELSQADNFKEEIEKLLIVAIGSKNSELYRATQDFIRRDPILKEIKFSHPLYNQVFHEHVEFIDKIKKEDIKAHNNALQKDLPIKVSNEKKLKI